MKWWLHNRLWIYHTLDCPLLSDGGHKNASSYVNGCSNNICFCKFVFPMPSCCCLIYGWNVHIMQPQIIIIIKALLSYSKKNTIITTQLFSLEMNNNWHFLSTWTTSNVANLCSLRCSVSYRWENDEINDLTRSYGVN